MKNRTDRRKSLAVRLAIGGMAALVVVLNIWSAMAAPALSNSGGGSWQYYRDISVTENSCSALSAYQVLVQLSSSNFPTNIKSDGSDLRFADANGNELSYWIESWDYAGKNAKIWVKASIPASAVATIRMYYGNPSASSSGNGDATFVFFDDFESGTLNKWDETYSGASVISENSNHILKLYSSDIIANYIRKNISSADIRLDLKYKIIQNGYYDGARFGSFLRSDYYYQLADWHSLGGGVPQRNLGRDSRSTLNTSPISYYSALGIWYYWGFSAVGSNPVELKGYGKDGEVVVSAIDSDNPPQTGQLKLWVWDTNAIDYVDDVRVRKFASLEPTLSLGAEQPISSDTTLQPSQ